MFRINKVIVCVQTFLLITLLGSSTVGEDGPKGDVVARRIEKLATEGVSIANQAVKLNPIWMKDGLSAEEQSKITDRLAGRRKKPFYRDSISATFESNIESIKVGERRAGYVVDFAFLVHASLDDVLKKTDDESGIDSLAGEGEMKVTELEIAAPSSEEEPGKPTESRLVHGQFTLLKKVLISSVVRTSMKKTKESITVAWEQDRSYDKSGKVSNHWKFVGAKKADKPPVYKGFAGYAKVTKLNKPAGALLVEYHYAFAEPQEWSEQKMSLRAKLSIALQESVRKSRRHIKKMAAAGNR